MPCHRMILSFKRSICFAVIQTEARVGIIWLTLIFDFEIINHTPRPHYKSVQDCAVGRIIGIPKYPSRKIIQKSLVIRPTLHSTSNIHENLMSNDDILISCVAWQFCLAERRSGVAGKFTREARENERRSREKNINRLPGFVAFSTAAPFNSF